MTADRFAACCVAEERSKGLLYFLLEGRAVAERRAGLREVARAERKRKEHERQAVSRACKGVRRAVRFYDLRRLLTFTNGDQGGGWRSRCEALEDVARFLKVHAAELFGSRPMVLVAERGSRGGRWHVHAAYPVGRRVEFEPVIERWSAFLEHRGWRSSTLHRRYGWPVHRFHAGDEDGRHKGGFSSARVAAGYLCKYLVKSLGGDLGAPGEHRYRVHGLKRPPVISMRSRSAWALESALGGSGQWWPVIKDGLFLCICFDGDFGGSPPLVLVDGGVLEVP